MSDTPLLHIEDLHKSYFLDGKRIDVLKGSALQLMPGEMAALTGPSGVGKSTFLHVVGTLDFPNSGEVRYEGVDVFSLPEAALADFRNRSIGFVFQFHYLIPELTALENVMQPALIRRVPRAEAARTAEEILHSVGLGDRIGHRPGELSGGEQQRVALARALVLRPRLLLADEPTGNLDDQTGEGIHALLVELNRRFGTAAIVVTHNERLAARMPRRLRLHDGVITEAPHA